MMQFDEYVRTLTPAEQVEFVRIKAVVLKLAPAATQGVSYAMPAFIYNGKALLSAMVNKKFLSIYPFSGKVVDQLREKLIDFEYTSGSIHFTLAQPIPEALLEDIIRARMAEIDK